MWGAHHSKSYKTEINSIATNAPQKAEQLAETAALVKEHHGLANFTKLQLLFLRYKLPLLLSKVVNPAEPLVLMLLQSVNPKISSGVAIDALNKILVS